MKGYQSLHMQGFPFILIWKAAATDNFQAATTHSVGTSAVLKVQCICVELKRSISDHFIKQDEDREEAYQQRCCGFPAPLVLRLRFWLQLASKITAEVESGTTFWLTAAVTSLCDL